MKIIQTYEQYNNTLILEKININSLLKKFKMTKNNKLKKIIVVSLLSIYTISQANTFINNQENLDNESKDIIISELDKIENEKNNKIDDKYKDPTAMLLSQEGWDHIRYEEGSTTNKGEPVLSAYKLGDGMVTIGYGHAQRIKQYTTDKYKVKKYWDDYTIHAVYKSKELKITKNDITKYNKFVMKSKYNIGDKITKEQAQKLFIKDVNVAAKGVKRMFKDWKKQGINIKLTQNQYDVLVSIAFNKGVYGFKKSKFVKELKKGNLDKTAELIRKEADTANFSGVEKRRIKESEKFST